MKRQREDNTEEKSDVKTPRWANGVEGKRKKKNKWGSRTKIYGRKKQSNTRGQKRLHKTTSANWKIGPGATGTPPRQPLGGEN